ncbi:hypothetical protein C942_04098 [Photobacterium marinum]|uniref:Uncharacterized protein n=1 Tax=Photobacterium marinum TaxID=1056511 RepID=L8J2Y5_9GAMM|nr:hypothetical protein C942_04098 [Photobacterium marinum]
MAKRRLSDSLRPLTLAMNHRIIHRYNTVKGLSVSLVINPEMQPK